MVLDEDLRDHAGRAESFSQQAANIPSGTLTNSNRWGPKEHAKTYPSSTKIAFTWRVSVSVTGLSQLGAGAKKGGESLEPIAKWLTNVPVLTKSGK
jgi:hypothetical protein